MYRVRLADFALRASYSAGYQYKIELRMRNHHTMSRSALIDGLAKAIPERHKVDLDNPEVFILVEVFKVGTIPRRSVRKLNPGQSICGMSVVKDYYQLHKFNVMEIAHAKNEDAQEGRVPMVGTQQTEAS